MRYLKNKSELRPGVVVQALNASTQEAESCESAFKHKYPRYDEVHFEVPEPHEKTTRIFIPHTMLNIWIS